MAVLSFVVFGQPAPQGSVKAHVQGGRAVVTSDNKKLRPWRDSVMWAARDALEKHSERPTFPMIGPVDLRIEFWLYRPKNRSKTIDVLPLVPPDLDKLIRAVNDSLVNAGIVRDDSQVTDIRTSKRYAVSPDLAKIYVNGFHRHEPCAVVVVREKDDA